MAGLEAARARGKTGGRVFKLNPKQVVLLKSLHSDTNVPIKEVLATFKISAGTLYNYVNNKSRKKMKNTSAENIRINKILMPSNDVIKI